MSKAEEQLGEDHLAASAAPVDPSAVQKLVLEEYQALMSKHAWTSITNRVLCFLGTGTLLMASSLSLLQVGLAVLSIVMIVVLWVNEAWLLKAQQRLLEEFLVRASGSAGQDQFIQLRWRLTFHESGNLSRKVLVLEPFAWLLISLVTAGFTVWVIWG
jgi:hypothetical protein